MERRRAMKKVLDVVGGVLLLMVMCVALLVLLVLVLALLSAWVLPIVAAWLWSWWWLLAEVPIVALYAWVWKSAQIREMKTVINGEDYAYREEETVG